ncbi:hypothetical protein [Breoghania sp.]|uniref:DUF7933 domain-containing protein n=1 Tax=Breoghania sp. TaxID=2065378 RepID=UPI00260B51AC|nr:hypothetical protein [Breoghania sp.]MDJ0931102.1 hypothetical protein [Breoghania sp.]
MTGARKFFAVIALLLGAMLTTAQTVCAQPTFSAAFSPSTIAAGFESVLTFTITNGTSTSVTWMTFSNTLLAGMTVADVPPDRNHLFDRCRHGEFHRLVHLQRRRFGKWRECGRE